jgi:hypothetical protein
MRSVILALLVLFVPGLAVVAALLILRTSPTDATPASASPREHHPRLMDDTEPPPRRWSRHEFTAAMAKIEEGTPEDQVLALLGKPDDIRTHYDPGGISTCNTREVWCYGTNGHLTFPTLGCISIDRDGKALFVAGGRDSPPDPTLLPEQELRSLLRLIDKVPSYNSGYTYDPLALIRAVNALRPLGKDKALAVLTEYLRIASIYNDSGSEGVFLVLRVLFDVPADPGYMPHMYVGAPIPEEPTDPKRLPHFPLLLLDDVPLLLVTGYMLAGRPQAAEDHIAYFREKGHLRAKPLTPGSKPLHLLDRCMRSAGWLYGNDGPTGGKVLIANQLLGLVDSVYRRKADVHGFRFHAETDLDKRWNDIVAEVDKLDICWNPALQRYTYTDGSHLPDPVRKTYRRSIWKLETRFGDSELILERKDDRHVIVIMQCRGTEKDVIPLARVKVSAATDEGKTLAAMQIGGVGGLAGGGTFSQESRLVELAEGEEVQVNLEIGKEVKVGPRYRP